MNLWLFISSLCVFGLILVDVKSALSNPGSSHNISGHIISRRNKCHEAAGWAPLIQQDKRFSSACVLYKSLDSNNLIPLTPNSTYRELKAVKMIKFAILIVALFEIATASPTVDKSLLLDIQERGIATAILSFKIANVAAVRSQVAAHRFGSRSAKAGAIAAALARHASETQA